jgi:hypothetical protein
MTTANEGERCMVIAVNNRGLVLGLDHEGAWTIWHLGGATI